MPHIVKSTILNAPTDAAWAVLRDFNGHDRWHPAVATSTIERAQPSDKIGCVRRFKLQDGSELREQLLALSDLEQTFSYCLLDTPIPMFNYVAHVRLLPVRALSEMHGARQGRQHAHAGRTGAMAALLATHLLRQQPWRRERRMAGSASTDGCGCDAGGPG